MVTEKSMKVFFRINSYTDHIFMFWVWLMCFKCIDDLKVSRVRRTQSVAKAKGMRSSVKLLI